MYATAEYETGVEMSTTRKFQNFKELMTSPDHKLKRSWEVGVELYI